MKDGWEWIRSWRGHELEKIKVGEQGKRGEWRGEMRIVSPLLLGAIGVDRESESEYVSGMLEL